MKPSLKELVARSGNPTTIAPQPSTPDPQQEPPRTYRTAQTRVETRQVSGHFKPEVSQTLRLIAAEQGRDIQEILG